MIERDGEMYSDDGVMHLPRVRDEHGRVISYGNVPARVGHGHVTPNADGSKARCGGPGICTVCARELQALADGEAVLRLQGISYARVRALVDVAFWTLYGERATRDVRAHRPTCDYATHAPGLKPRPCMCAAEGEP